LTRAIIQSTLKQKRNLTAKDAKIFSSDSILFLGVLGVLGGSNQLFRVSLGELKSW
jgi:hypothetical protein